MKNVVIETWVNRLCRGCESRFIEEKVFIIGKGKEIAAVNET